MLASDTLSLTESSASASDANSSYSDKSKVVKRPRVKRCSSEISDSSEPSGLRVNKRNEPYKIRVLKNDTRKYLVFMMLNSINSGDLKLIRKFHRKYFRPDTILTDFSGRLASIGHGIALNVMKGSESILGFTKAMLELTPDICIEIQDTELRVRQDNTSIITSRIAIRLTMTSKPKVRECDVKITELLEQGNNLMKSDANGLQAIGPRADEVEMIIRDRALSVGDWFEDVTPLAKPVHFQSHGVWIIRLDAKGFVLAMDIVDEISAREYLFLPKYPERRE